MNGNVLQQERLTVVAAVESTTFAEAWYWERDATAGPVCAEAVCLGHAQSSDALILLLGEDLTPITRREYEVARGFGVPCIVMLVRDSPRSEEAEAFVNTVRQHSVTTSFANLSELSTQVADALRELITRAVRKDNTRRRHSIRARQPISNPYNEVSA